MTTSEPSAAEVPSPRNTEAELEPAEPYSDAATREAADQLITNIVIELGRADSKAGILLGWVGAAVAVLTATASGRHLAIAAAVMVWAADACLAMAVAMLLFVVRPSLKPGVSWIRYANADPSTILADIRKNSSEKESVAWQSARVAELSRLALNKYRRIRWSVDLLFASGVFLVLALLAAV